MVAASPRVFCIIVNWNGWADTLRCLESVNTNLYDNVSLLLVDNGSTDDSVSRIRSAFPDLEIIESKVNLGFGSGNNLGIRYALESGANYVWLLNNDTIVQPNTLAELVSHAELHPELGEIGSVLYYAQDPSRIQAWGGGKVNLWTGTSRHYHHPVKIEKLDFLTAASVLIPMEVLRKVGLFDEGYFMYWEDTDLSFRIKAAGWQLGVAPDAKLLHKEGTSTGATNPAFDRYVTVYGIKFALRYAPFPLVPIFMIIVARAINRFRRGEWKRGWAILTVIMSSALKITEQSKQE
jgi:GT2 family glycosyltransferase